MDRRRAFTTALAVAGLVAPAAAWAAPVRTARPADNAARGGGERHTEWWFVGVHDPRTGLAVAAALGSDFPAGPPATAVLAFPPGGPASTLVVPHLGRPHTSRARVRVRLGPDALSQVGPGAWRLRVGMPAPIALSGPARPVAIDLTVRARTPGFVAGPLALGGGQSMGWTVAAPAARADGRVRVGGRVFRVRAAPAYHDHNWGPFDLAGAAVAGWDWAQVPLPGRRALTLGLVKTRRAGEQRGVAVLSGPGGRLGTAPAGAVRVRYASWGRAGGFAYPRRVSVDARLSGGWRVRLVSRARLATPLAFDRSGRNALVEVAARSHGWIARGGVRRAVRDAAGLYEYQSSPLARERDRAPGSTAAAVLHVAGELARAGDRVRPAGRAPAD